ncbi:unnamed protein product [Parnassius apollo]|uniref:(apollo) hypothetical protein n=1 Tax=Parnassius apollo TaxID=110799 RepID=A0A8S3WJ44_PARAO|nr:unnamed protein product [Parnassius apollo]
MNGRARRILSLVPARNAGSDVSDGSSSDDEVRDVESSPAPSLDSSFEKLDILGSPTSSPNHSKQEVESRAEDFSDVDSETFQVSLTPILNAVFPSLTQCNYDAIPLISSVSSITSVEPSTLIADVTPLVTRGQRKRTGPSVSVNKVKRRCIKKLTLRFRWKKVSFQHRADIPNNTFEDEVPVDWSPLDYFFRFFFRPQRFGEPYNHEYQFVQRSRNWKVAEEE